MAFDHFRNCNGSNPYGADASRARSARNASRVSSWMRDLSGAASILMAQTDSTEDRAGVEALYSKAIEAGPEFLSYRTKSAFMAAPKLGIDRNAYARILNALEAIERGTYRYCRAKGKQGIPRTAARVLKALLNLALRYGEVRPSLEGIKYLACVCKQTVVNCLKVLALYGFVVVHRRIKRIRTMFGTKVVQDTNAYTIHVPKGLGALAVGVFRRTCESRKYSAPSMNLPSTCRTSETCEEKLYGWDVKS